jgi:hypothetical protein
VPHRNPITTGAEDADEDDVDNDCTERLHAPYSEPTNADSVSR